jgi:hypothetical protein
MPKYVSPPPLSKKRKKEEKKAAQIKMCMQSFPVSRDRSPSTRIPRAFFLFFVSSSAAAAWARGVLYV